jgi:hypothetical protein
MRVPRIVRWSKHADLRAAAYAIDRLDVEQLILGRHDRRQANRAGTAAAWRLSGHGLTVVYDHPDRGDPLVAVVVTVWRNK